MCIDPLVNFLCIKLAMDFHGNNKKKKPHRLNISLDALVNGFEMGMAHAGGTPNPCLRELFLTNSNVASKLASFIVPAEMVVFLLDIAETAGPDELSMIGKALLNPFTKMVHADTEPPVTLDVLLKEYIHQNQVGIEKFMSDGAIHAIAVSSALFYWQRRLPTYFSPSMVAMLKRSNYGTLTIFFLDRFPDVLPGEHEIRPSSAWFL